MATIPTIATGQNVKTPRRFARHRVGALMYLDLGPDNGGFPLNLSEDGLAFQGVRALRRDQEISITLRLNGIAEPVIATAKIIWLTESRKGGGLQFVNLPDATRKRIREWIAGEEENERNRQNALAATSPLTPYEPRTPAVIARELDGRALPVQRDAVIAPPVSSSVTPPPIVRPAAASSVSSEPKAQVAKPLPPALFQSLAPRKENPGKRIQPASDQKKRPSRFTWYGIGLAASIAALVVCGVALWTFRDSLLSRFDFNSPATTSVAAVAVPAPPNASEQSPVADPVNGAKTDEAAQLSSIPNEPEELPLPALTKPVGSAVAPRLRIAPPAALPSNRRAPEIVPPARPLAAPSVKPALETTRFQPPAAGSSVPVSASPISVAANQAPKPEAAPAKIAASEPNPPAPAATPTGTVEIILDPYPSIRTPAEDGAHPTQLGTSLQIGRLTSRVEPVYPPDALQHRIAGTVKVHIVVSRSGAVQSAEVVDGQALLADAALRAVQQLRYEPTKLGGTPVEVEEEVKLVFRVADTATAAK